MVRTATRVDNLLALLTPFPKLLHSRCGEKSETDFSWIIRCVANASTGKEVTLDFIFLRTFDRISRRRRLCYCSSSLPSSTSSSCFVPIMLLFSRCQPSHHVWRELGGRHSAASSKLVLSSFERGIFSPSRQQHVVETTVCAEKLYKQRQSTLQIWGRKKEWKKEKRSIAVNERARELFFAIPIALCSRNVR